MFTRTIVNYIRVIFGGNTFSNSLLKRIKGLLQPSGSKEISQGVSSLKVAMFLFTDGRMPYLSGKIFSLLSWKLLFTVIVTVPENRSKQLNISCRGVVYWLYIPV